jgi:hypothetical protein
VVRPLLLLLRSARARTQNTARALVAARHLRVARRGGGEQQRRAIEIRAHACRGGVAKRVQRRRRGAPLIVRGDGRRVDVRAPCAGGNGRGAVGIVVDLIVIDHRIVVVVVVVCDRLPARTLRGAGSQFLSMRDASGCGGQPRGAGHREVVAELDLTVRRGRAGHLGVPSVAGVYCRSSLWTGWGCK